MENAPYDTRTETRSLFNSPEMSDVCFLVDGQTVYGHKVILGMGSPVFKSMFFGDLKEQREVIEIEDLTSVGFKNALRYIYGFGIDFEFAELYESYMAADKYLLHHFGDALFGHIKRKLTVESCYLIFDQLMKIGEREEIVLASVRTWISENSKEVFESENFKQIDQEMLISLLSLNQLNIVEFDLLVAVLKWVDCEVQRQGLPVNDENRRKVFEPIKSYILFTDLPPGKIASCKEIAELLTSEERGALLLHQFDRENPSMIELKTARKVGPNFLSVFVGDARYFCELPYSEKTTLTVNRRISIRTIHTTYSERAQSVSLKISNSKFIHLDLVIERLVQGGRLCFSFKPPFVVEPNSTYTLTVTGNGEMTKEDHLSRQFRLNYKDSVIFDLKNLNGTHCVRGFDFYLQEQAALSLDEPIYESIFELFDEL